MPESFIPVFVFCLGAIVGSFLNVCIVRIPHGKSVAFPGSHCPKCQKPIAWYDNIPFFSFLFLGAKCRYCREKISIRYFIVELVMALGFWVFYLHFGMSILLLPQLIFFSLLMVATFVDLELRIIPDEISVGGIFAGLLLSAFLPPMHIDPSSGLNIGRGMMMIFLVILFVGFLFEFVFKKAKLEKEDVVFICIVLSFVLVEFFINWILTTGKAPTLVIPYLQSLHVSLLGVLVGGGIIYSMGELGDILFRKESMGGGDIKLLAMIGAFLGWKLAVLTFFSAPFLGSAIGIIEKIRTKDSAIAYGPFLAIAALAALIWGPKIIQGILHSYGF